VNGALHILVVDDEPDIALLVREILEDEGFTVSVARDAAEAREARRARRPDLVLLDIWLPDTDGISLLEEWARQSHLDTPVVMMSGHGTIETAVEATRLGAYDYIEKPLSTPKLLLSVHRALEAAKLRRENVGLRLDSDLPSEPIGRSQTMVDLRQQIRRVAQHDAPVLITGESGCGKNICARYLHAVSTRRSGPFVRMPADAGGKHDTSVVLFGTEEGSELVFGCLNRPTEALSFFPIFWSSTRRCRPGCSALCARGPFCGSAEQRPCTSMPGWWPRPTVIPNPLSRPANSGRTSTTI
jgi:DNA-binding NtrC family response regulator